MANRPVFLVSERENKIYERKNVEFQYFNGFSTVQKQRCIQSLHHSFRRNYPNYRILEISSKSENELGIKLSAFNLQITLHNGKKVSVECAFQAGKIFEHGGPYIDLLDGSSRQAKKDDRLKNSGRVIGFSLEDESFPIMPQTLFYNWIYIKAPSENKDLADSIMNFDAFTDIVFNPEKSINCQAQAAAIYVALRRKNLLEAAMESKEKFAELIYGVTVEK